MDCCAGLIGQVGRRIHLRASERLCVLFHVPYGMDTVQCLGRRRARRQFETCDVMKLQLDNAPTATVPA
ncbi:hypothetical protein V8C43DRAFT_273492 [Trichoderma afarasin]